MDHRCLAFVVAGAASSLAQAQPSAPASAGARFDGPWQVTIACPHNTEKSAARGYRRQFDAIVKDGVLSGESGDARSPGWLRIDGRIGADGNAVLDARGRTGNPDYAVNQPAPSTSYSYRIDAHFDDRQGTGKRLEQRVCNFDFDRK